MRVSFLTAKEEVRAKTIVLVVLVCTFCGEAPGCKVVERRASLGAAGRGCTLVFEPLVTILLSLLHPMVAWCLLDLSAVCLF